MNSKFKKKKANELKKIIFFGMQDANVRAKFYGVWTFEELLKKVSKIWFT